MDELPGHHEITTTVLDLIRGHDAVIADFTMSPRNVYFEAGFALGADRPLIQIARVDTRLEFDRKTWQTIKYVNATDLESQLRPALRHLVRMRLQSKKAAEH